ncbi:MAG TPA: 2-polyprenyl-3-methyl-6-methoxy-1,4-benzoquinone monooxygenase, partial [Candidatus Acidoferrum sp.]|nr:2-polyprenyl-3-methyl-6-methoxy-1,4-benzoquinone monooxygenase [Candidatus Acidoferrum sp.]
MSLIDKLIIQADQALRTLVPGSVSASEPNPADQAGPTQLETAEQRHAAGLMRINHCGEVCAQALYQGQALTAKLPEVRSSMEQAAQEEFDHLAWCESRLKELGSQPSVLNPLFYGLSYGIGALAGLAGDKWSLGFVNETEQQVCKHLEEHLQSLPASDAKSRLILERMLRDEGRHAVNAQAAGAAPLPIPVQQAMGLLARAMKTA